MRTFARGMMARKETVVELSASAIKKLERTTHRRIQGYILEVWRSGVPTRNEQSVACQSVVLIQR